MSNNQSTTPSPTPSTQNQMSLGQKIRWVFIAILAIIVIIFTAQNANPVKVEFFNQDMEISLILVILFSMFFGGILTLLVFRSRRRR